MTYLLPLKRSRCPQYPPGSPLALVQGQLASDETFNWKQSAYLLRLYILLGLVNESEVSLESWNVKNYTIVHNIDESGVKLHTCFFTCPISGNHYPCGQLKKSKAVQLKGAASAKAIDCLLWQNGNQGTPLRCTDVPLLLPSVHSLSMTSPPLPLLSRGIAKILAEKRLASQNAYKTMIQLRFNSCSLAA